VIKEADKGNAVVILDVERWNVKLSLTCLFISS
jgi:hypothetical protein